MVWLIFGEQVRRCSWFVEATSRLPIAMIAIIVHAVYLNFIHLTEPSQKLFCLYNWPFQRIIWLKVNLEGILFAVTLRLQNWKLSKGASKLIWWATRGRVNVIHILRAILELCRIEAIAGRDLCLWRIFGFINFVILLLNDLLCCVVPSFVSTQGLVRGEKSSVGLHDTNEVLTVLQTSVWEFWSGVAVCKAHQSFHLFHLATTRSPGLRAEYFGLRLYSLSPFNFFNFMQVSDEAFIYLIHFGFVLVLDFIEFFHLFFNLLLNFKSLLSCSFSANLCDLVVSEDVSAHLALLSAWQFLKLLRRIGGYGHENELGHFLLALTFLSFHHGSQQSSFLFFVFVHHTEDWCRLFVSVHLCGWLVRQQGGLCRSICSLLCRCIARDRRPLTISFLWAAWLLNFGGTLIAAGYLAGDGQQIILFLSWFSVVNFIGSIAETSGGSVRVRCRVGESWRLTASAFRSDQYVVGRILVFPEELTWTLQSGCILFPLNSLLLHWSSASHDFL